MRTRLANICYNSTYLAHLGLCAKYMSIILQKIQNILAQDFDVKNWYLLANPERVIIHRKIRHNFIGLYLKWKCWITMHRYRIYYTCWNLLTLVKPVSAPLSSFLCKTPKSARRSGNSVVQPTIDRIHTLEGSNRCLDSERTKGNEERKEKKKKKRKGTSFYKYSKSQNRNKM